MKNTPFAIAAGLAAVAVAGLVGAQFVKTHTMTVRLPDGGEAHVFYSGSVPPAVAFGSATAPINAAWSEAWAADVSPFAEMDRVSAEMDREAAMMLRAAGDPSPVAFPPAGTDGYSFVSTLSGSGICARSVEIIADRRSERPRVIERTSGDCAAEPRPAQPAIGRAPDPVKPAVIAARYDVPIKS